MSTRTHALALGIGVLVTGVLIISGVAAPAFSATAGSTGHPHVKVDPNSRRVVADPTAGALSDPSTAAPADVALGFVRANAGDFGLSADAAAQLYPQKQFALSTGATAVHLGQRVDGLRVRDAVMTAVVGADGRLLSVAGFLAPGDGTGTTATLTAQTALDVAADAQDADASRPLREAATKSAKPREYPNVYAEGVTEPAPVTAELVWYPDANGTRSAARLAHRHRIV